MHLITRERALRNLNNLSATAEEHLLIDALIAAVSAAIERYCRRRFAAQQYDELYHGVQSASLLLKNFPVISIDRIAYGPETVLYAQNSSSTNQRATAQVRSDGLRLTRVALGTTTTSDLAFSSYGTLTSIAAAITALGNGWTGTVANSTYNDWPSSDLRAIQGAFNAKDVNAEMKLHVSELSAYDAKLETGEIMRTSGDCFLSTANLDWSGSLNYWRVIYNAGWLDIPEDIQEACAQIVASFYWLSKRDPGLSQEQIPSVVSRSSHDWWPKPTAMLLQPYRVLRV